MGMVAPGWVRAVLAWIGDVEWPGGDEDACEAQAKQWGALAARMETLKDHAIGARNEAFQGFIEGDYHDSLAPNFRTALSQIDGQIANYRYLEDSLNAHAKNIRDTKHRFKIAIARFLAENALALAAGGLFSLGAKLALRAVLQGVERAAVRTAIKAGETLVPKVLEIPKPLQLGLAVAKVAKFPVLGAASMGVADAGGQGLNIALGGTDRTTGQRQTTFNLGEVKNSARDGAIMGGIAGPLGHVPIKNLGNRFLNAPQKFTRSVGSNTAGAAGAQYYNEGHVNFGDALKSGLTATMSDPIGIKDSFAKPHDTPAPTAAPPEVPKQHPTEAAPARLDDPPPNREVAYPQEPAHAQTPAHAEAPGKAHETSDLGVGGGAWSHVPEGAAHGPSAAHEVKAPASAAPEQTRQPPSTEPGNRPQAGETPRPPNDPPLSQRPPAQTTSLSAPNNGHAADVNGRPVAGLAEDIAAGAPTAGAPAQAVLSSEAVVRDGAAVPAGAAESARPDGAVAEPPLAVPPTSSELTASQATRADAAVTQPEVTGARRVSEMDGADSSRSGVPAEKAAVAAEKPAPAGEKSAPASERSGSTAEKPAAATEKLAPATEKANAAPEKAGALPSKSAVVSAKPTIEPVKAAAHTQQPVAESAKVAPTPHEPGAARDEHFTRIDNDGAARDGSDPQSSSEPQRGSDGPADSSAPAADRGWRGLPEQLPEESLLRRESLDEAARRAQEINKSSVDDARNLLHEEKQLSTEIDKAAKADPNDPRLPELREKLAAVKAGVQEAQNRIHQSRELMRAVSATDHLAERLAAAHDIAPTDGTALREVQRNFDEVRSQADVLRAKVNQLTSERTMLEGERRKVDAELEKAIADGDERLVDQLKADKEALSDRNKALTKELRDASTPLKVKDGHLRRLGDAERQAAWERLPAETRVKQLSGRLTEMEGRRAARYEEFVVGERAWDEMVRAAEAPSVDAAARHLRDVQAQAEAARRADLDAEERTRYDEARRQVLDSWLRTHPDHPWLQRELLSPQDRVDRGWRTVDMQGLGDRLAERGGEGVQHQWERQWRGLTHLPADNVHKLLESFYDDGVKPERKDNKLAGDLFKAIRRMDLVREAARLVDEGRFSKAKDFVDQQVAYERDRNAATHEPDAADSGPDRIPRIAGRPAMGDRSINGALGQMWAATTVIHGTADPVPLWKAIDRIAQEQIASGRGAEPLDIGYRNFITEADGAVGGAQPDDLRPAGVHDAGSRQAVEATDAGQHPSGLSLEQLADIVGTEKGSRPDPAEYLSPEYIAQHLDEFRHGASRFMPESNLNKYGIAQRDGTAFVVPKAQADALLARTQGEPRALERELGLPEGFLDSHKLVRIDIPHPDEANVRMPSGNEAGANDQWIPGGKLPDGTTEAVLDGAALVAERYTVTDLDTATGHGPNHEPGMVDIEHPGESDPPLLGPEHGGADGPGGFNNPAEHRTYGPGALAPVEDPAHQSAVEAELRQDDGSFARGADPRTNPYGQLINDGGIAVAGRDINCLDCSLSALASFHGHPTVSAPRNMDFLADGSVDRSGEQNGLARAARWLGDTLQLSDSSTTIREQFAALHDRIARMGPDSSALVVTEWHARDPETGELRFNENGAPVIETSHATVVVYPRDAEGPVWWDPQQGLTSDHPPEWMVNDAARLWSTPITADHFDSARPEQGVDHGESGNTGTSAGLPRGDLPEPYLPGAPDGSGMDLHPGSDAGRDADRQNGGPGQDGARLGDRNGDRVPELARGDGGERPHGGQADGTTERPAELSTPVAHHDATAAGGLRVDHLQREGAVAEEPARTPTRVSADDQQTHVGAGADGHSGERGDVVRGVEQSAESGDLARRGDDRNLEHRQPDEVQSTIESLEADRTAAELGAT